MTKLISMLSMIIVFVIGCAGVGIERAPESELTFDRIIEVPGYTKAQLFDVSILWMASTLKSNKQVLEYSDKPSGVIVGNGTIPYPRKGLDWTVPFLMKIETKDGRFRMTFSQLRLFSPPSQGSDGLDILVWQKSDLEMIKPLLLAMGDNLLSYLDGIKSSNTW